MKRNDNAALRLTAYRETGETEKIGYPLILSAMLITGMLLVFIPAFESIHSSPWVFALAGALLCLAMIRLFQGRFGDTGLIGSVVLGAVFAAAFFGKVKSGSLMLTNDFLGFLSTKTGHIYLAFETGEASDVYWVLGVMLFILCAFIAKASLASSSVFLLLPLALLAAGTAAGFFSVNAGTVILASALVLMALRRLQLRADPACPEGSLWIHTAAAALCAVIIISGFFLAGLRTDGMISSVKRAYHEYVYDEDTNSMPEGYLSDLPAWEPSNAPALAVTADEWSKLYLRGFTGEVYTGTSWESLDTEVLAEYSDMFYWLHDGGFFAQSSIASAMEATGNDGPVKMEIENISACEKYAYMPCSAVVNTLMDPTLIGDSVTEGKRYEVLEYYPGSIPEWYALQHLVSARQSSEETKGYLLSEQQYRDFVYEKYLQITPTAVATLKKYLDSDEKSRSLTDIRKIILKVLDEKLTYDENASVPSGKTDFLTCLFEQENKGYSVSYATAAVLMLRYYGVPSRYVEGYYLSGEDASALSSGQRVILDEYHAHAWAEYYLDGVGWIPFEVTPGYVDESEFELGEAGSEGNVAYSHNELVYAPAIQPQPLEEVSGPRMSFKITRPFVYVLLALAASAFVTLCAIRRRRLRKALEKIGSSDNRSAVAMLYGYALLLLQKASITDEEDEAAKSLNREAMFSDHEMSDISREEMEDYVERVKEMCRQKWNFLRRFYYRFVNCLYL
ncbi:MAG: transglutaminase domain-containing protein [Eubacteriaceae bacterium]|nr:transglutaminase domain-containing protein [Eubacteriaceae bacterium]